MDKLVACLVSLQESCGFILFFFNIYFFISTCGNLEQLPPLKVQSTKVRL